MDGALQEVDDLLIQLSKDRLNEMGTLKADFSITISRKLVMERCSMKMT